jgi:gluconolactonase
MPWNRHTLLTWAVITLAAHATACSSSGKGTPAGRGGRGADGSADAHTPPVTYPPLVFSDIGTPSEISGQFLFTEGPVWDPTKQVLYFTDINADTLYRLTLPDTLDTALNPMQNADGLALDSHGEVIAAGFVSRSIWKLSGSRMQTLAATYQGKKLNSPDDLIARSDGVIYFTDPLFGINGTQGFPAQASELGFQGVYRLTTDGTLHLEDQTNSGPNGVQLSPDEHTLYVSYTNTGEVHTFTVAVDGSLGDKKLFASSVPIADSMCVDAGGNLYVASLNGIAVFDPVGAPLGTIALSEVPTNGAFGGPDQKTFFITARKGLVGTPTPGNSSLYRIDGMPIPGLPGRP